MLSISFKRWPFLYFWCQTDPFYDDLKVLIVDSVSAVIYPSLGGQQMDGKYIIEECPDCPMIK